MNISESIRRESQLLYYALLRQQKMLTARNVADPSAVAVSVASSLAAWYGLTNSAELKLFLRHILVHLSSQAAFKRDHESYTMRAASKG
jgi:hypothetical protein